MPRAPVLAPKRADQIHVGAVAEGGEDLLPVDDKVIVIARCGGAYGGAIGASLWLCSRDADFHLPFATFGSTRSRSEAGVWLAMIRSETFRSCTIMTVSRLTLAIFYTTR